MAAKYRVCVVDDDAAVRESIQQLLKANGIESIGFATSQDFMAADVSKKVGCLILDVRLPGISGLDIQEILLQKKTAIPVIVLTGHADVPLAVRATKNGAIDVLEKPFTPAVLLQRVKEALDLYGRWQKVEQERQVVAERIALLTPREREVFDLMAAGVKNLAIAQQLGISRKTLDIHRLKVISKTKARTAADLARWSLLEQSGPGGTVNITAGGYVPKDR